MSPKRAIFYYKNYERRRFKPSAFVDLTAAAKNDDGDENDNPAAIVVAEERIKAAHCNASLHYLKIMKIRHFMCKEFLLICFL